MPVPWYVLQTHRTRQSGCSPSEWLTAGDDQHTRPWDGMWDEDLPPPLTVELFVCQVLPGEPERL